MIPRAPSLFLIEEGEAVKQATPLAASGELVGLRLIIQSSSPGQQRMAVLRRSAMRFPATSASKRQESGRRFVGPEFFERCFCCHKKLDGDMDVFVYKGEQAFCSTECRCQQMAKDERREIEILARKRRDAFHSRRAAPAKMRGSNLHTTVQTAA